VVARAGGRTLRVFVPTWADRSVVARLESLGARIEVCPRVEGVSGDPTYRALQRAIAAGALPFTCQGNQNGLAIEGGETLGYEMASTLREDGVALDRLFVQVGGGALASSAIQGLREAVRLGAIPRMPRIDTVQTEGGFPLKRAYDRVVERLASTLGMAPAGAARSVAGGAQDGALRETLRHAATHRSRFMWPWEEEPKSIAHGILDDETYDWLAVVRGMLETGGEPVVVPEERLVEANRLAREATGIDVDHTGSSGLAGLLQLRDQDDIVPGERVAVLFTGVRR
jgi:threonine synthase